MKLTDQERLARWLHKHTWCLSVNAGWSKRSPWIKDIMRKAAAEMRGHRVWLDEFNQPIPSTERASKCAANIAEKSSMSDEQLKLTIRLSPLMPAIMLAQQMGEISESKAVELLGLNHEDYREAKQSAVEAVLLMVERLPSLLSLHLENMTAQQKSSMPKS